MGQKFAKKFRCCGRTPSNESLTHVSSLFGNSPLNSDTSVFSSITKVSNSDQIQKYEVSDTKAVEEKVDTKSDSPTLSEHGSDTKNNQPQENTEDTNDICLCLCEPIRSDSSDSGQQSIPSRPGGNAKTTSSHSLNTDGCPCSELMCSSFITRSSRSLSSLVRLIDDTNDLFQCPCILCSTRISKTPSFITICETKLLEAAHSSSTETSVSTSSNSEMSKSTVSTNFSAITQSSGNTSSLCRTESLCRTCTSKNSCSLSSSSTTCTESSLYSSGSSNSCSSCASKTDSSNIAARSSSSGISLCTLFGNT